MSDNLNKVEEILNSLTAVYDEAGVFGEPPTKSGFTIIGKEEATQALLEIIDNEKIAELENIAGRKFSDDEMMGMDSKNAQASRAINAYIDDIKDRIATLKKGEVL